MNLLSVRREVGEFRKRYKWMALFVSIIFAVLLGRMVQLQLVDYAHYEAIARENITRTLTLPATRGIVRDRNGAIVVTNRASYSVYITPHYFRAEDAALLTSLMGLSEEEQTEMTRRLADVPERRRTHQIRFFTDISRERLAALESHDADFTHRVGRMEVSGVDVVARPVRTYPFGHLAAHAVGYLNELTAEELDELRPAGYRLGDRIGRSGIERSWEAFLRGRRGYRRVPVDARGHTVDSALIDDGRPLLEPALPGRDLTLTLDMELMRTAERAFRGQPNGAAVVVDVHTGDILALFSKPSYDLNEMTGGLSRERYAEMRDPRSFRPLIDRTIYQSYFPGSTFKPFGVIAALEGGVMSQTEPYECTGRYEGSSTFAGGFRPRCTATHGEVDMRRAMVVSCNAYFYHLAERVGLDPLARIAQDFGLGRRTGVGINSESAGFIPTRAWYEARGTWQGGIALNTAIGQGDTRVTLVQLALSYAAIANGGTLYVPQLVRSVREPDGTVVEDFAPRVRRRVHVDPAHLAFVIDSMYGVVNDEAGTAAAARIEGGVPIAGKTGTAQIYGRARADRDAGRGPYHRRAHAWFAGFAPAEAPEVAIVVLVDHGGPGGRVAAPIAIQILQEYLGDRGETVTAMATPTGAR